MDVYFVISGFVNVFFAYYITFCYGIISIITVKKYFGKKCFAHYSHYEAGTAFFTCVAWSYFFREAAVGVAPERA